MFLKINKSQLSLEFIIVLFVLMLFFSVLFMAYYQRSVELNLYQENVLAEKIIVDLASAINKVHITGNNYEKSLFLPQTINGVDYFVEILNQDRLVIISWNQNMLSWPILTNNILSNFNLKQEITISNREGVIHVE